MQDPYAQAREIQLKLASMSDEQLLKLKASFTSSQLTHQFPNNQILNFGHHQNFHGPNAALGNGMKAKQLAPQALAQSFFRQQELPVLPTSAASAQHQIPARPLSNFTQLQVLEALGAPGLKWTELWKMFDIQAIYNCFYVYDKRLQSTGSGTSRRLWISEESILLHLQNPPACFSIDEESSTYLLSRILFRKTHS